ncbi:MAG: hypothetical protein ACJ76Y_21315 [Thermoanaerobaculia bacterium]
MNERMSLKFVTALVLLFAFSSLAHAQATRTWVSGVGDDANPCSRTAPCKTFAGAISKTAAGGEINVLDPGGFGGVTINKSITISSEGFEAGVLVSGTNAIIINALATDVVVLRGLDIEGLGTGLVGIKVLGGLAALHIEKCTINAFRGSNGSGIEIAPTTAGTMKLFIKDTIVRNNGQGVGGGIFSHPGAGVSVKGALDNVRLENNTGFGFRAQDRSTLSVHDSDVSGNSAAGIVGLAVAGGTVSLMLDNVMVGNNGTDCVASGTNTTVNITHVTVYGCATGLNAAGGTIVSSGQNFNQFNTTPGAPTSTPGQQ